MRRGPGHVKLGSTPFVGRVAEIAGLLSWLEAARCVTITGIGGIGKTSLARRVAESVGSNPDDRVIVADLAHATDAAAVRRAVATAAGADVDQLERRLNDGSPLVLLDTCDRVVDIVAELVAVLDGRCPRLRVLATSQQPLGVADEHIWQLAPLALPADEATPAQVRTSEAVQMFLARTARRAPRPDLDEDALVAVADICRRLDGIPLALELAAARAATMPVQELKRQLSSGLAILDSRGREAREDRHRGLYAALEWSMQAMEPIEQDAFRVLATFEGNFTMDDAYELLEAANVGAGRAVELVDALVERSIVSAIDADPCRFRMLDTVRQFGRERLADDDRREQIGMAHAITTARRVEAIAAGIIGRDEAVRRVELERCLPEMTAAARVAAGNGDAELASALIRGLPFSFLYGHHPGPAVCRLAAELAGIKELSTHADGPSVLAAAALHRLAADGPDPAAALSRAALAQARDYQKPRSLTPWLAHSWICWLQGRRDETIALVAEALEIAGPGRFPIDRITAGYGMASYLVGVGQTIEARAYAEASIAAAKSTGSPSLLASALVLGSLAVHDSEPVKARARLERGVELGADTGGLVAVALGEWGLRISETRPLDPPGPRRPDFLALQAVLGRADRDQDTGALAIVVQVIARCIAYSDPVSAAQLDGASRVLGPLGILGDHRQPFESTLAEQLGPTGATAHRERGALLSFSETVALAQSACAAQHRTADAPSPTVGHNGCIGSMIAGADGWTVDYRETTSCHRPSKGLGYLATLLATPGREIHVLDLCGARGGPTASSSRQPVLDERARTELRRALADLDAEIEDALSAADTERAARARAARDQFVDSLADAYGLGGRPRMFDDEVERCRKAVWKCVHTAIAGFDSANPALARHLRNTVSTGTYCRYQPEGTARWEIALGVSSDG